MSARMRNYPDTINVFTQSKFNLIKLRNKKNVIINVIFPKI